MRRHHVLEESEINARPLTAHNHHERVLPVCDFALLARQRDDVDDHDQLRDRFAH
jgi:hypothetical protein